MAQLYTPGQSSFFRALYWGTPLMALLVFGIGLALKYSAYGTEVGMVMEQPVPFSHQHHVKDLGIDCRYCHTTVEKSAFAGMPSAHTCMSCHSQIWKDSPLLEPIRESARTGNPILWNRVNRLPKYVYFHHGIHVHRGVSCVSCHGDVGSMPLLAKHRSFTMRDCLECHSHLESAESLTSCSTCHR